VGEGRGRWVSGATPLLQGLGAAVQRQRPAVVLGRALPRVLLRALAEGEEGKMMSSPGLGAQGRRTRGAHPGEPWSLGTQVEREAGARGGQGPPWLPAVRPGCPASGAS